MPQFVRSLTCLAFCAIGASVSACATGQGSFIGGAAPRDVASAQPAVGPAFETTTPNLIVVSGNALLPGSRRPAATAALLGVSDGTTEAPLVAPALTTGAVRVSLAGQPLLSLPGSNVGLLGAADTLVSSGTGAGATAASAPRVTASTASAALLTRLTTLAQPAAPGIGAPPLTSPLLASAAPGLIPLKTLVAALPTTLGGLVGH